MPEPDGAPLKCFFPSGLRTWGWAVQLYAARSRASWGIGDLGDLRSLAQDTARSNGVILINPLHASTPRLPLEPSPYFAGSRCFHDPLYLRIEEVPGAPELGDLERLAREGRALNEGRRIDRDRVQRLKMTGLEQLWERFRGDDDFEAYRAEMGAPLEDFATYVALTETHGGSWRAWPSEYRHPGAPDVDGFRRAERTSVRFHEWVQWLVDVQLARTAATGNVVHDLAVGVDPDGADAWIWQDVFADQVSVGAPPDDYNPEGQDWAALAFDPWALVESSFEPFVYLFRSMMRHAAGLRIDHVMGLFRLFWIPAGAPATEGAYVRYPARRMLDIVAEESRRAGCYVVGEDLGTVEPGVREEMSARSMLSYKLMWFEEDPPATYPELCMAAPNTHDLPTTAGLWTGEDSHTQIELGLDPNEEFKEKIIRRIMRQTGVDRAAPVSEVVNRSYEALAASPSALVMGSLEDALKVAERHNQPGTIGPWNWSTALPLPLEEVLRHPRTQELSQKLSSR